MVTSSTYLTVGPAIGNDGNVRALASLGGRVMKKRKRLDHSVFDDTAENKRFGKGRRLTAKEKKEFEEFQKVWPLINVDKDAHGLHVHRDRAAFIWGFLVALGTEAHSLKMSTKAAISMARELYEGPTHSPRWIVSRRLSRAK
jgi:hypothetical protein